MPINSFSQWDGTDESANTDLNDIPLQENRTRPSHVNELFREMMKQLKAALGAITPVPFTAASASGPASLEFAEDTDNGAHKVTLKAPASVAADVDVTLPGAAGTLATLTGTETLTNKRITPRVTSEASSATPTINTDNCDIHRITALATNITSMATNLSGTPTHGQSLIVEITGTATRTIAWGASFEASTTALPTTTDGTNMLSVGFKWNSATSKWRCLAVA
jgi:hypothetical protein